MAKTIVVCGHGPGISSAVARKFGSEGFSVALVARSAERLKAGVAGLADKGIRALAFPTDLADPSAAEALIAKVRAELGPITVLHWNAYASTGGDLTTAPAAELRTAIDVSVTSLAAAVRTALPDLAASKESALLVTGGGFAFYDANVDQMAVEWNSMGTALGKAAQHKLVGLLAAKLGKQGIYVGEVMVMGIVKGTRFDTGSATLEASSIADAFWKLYRDRAPLSVTVS